MFVPKYTKRLEVEIGFKGEIQDHDTAFESRCCDLEAFRDMHGNCHVPVVYLDNSSLGIWCKEMRCAERKIKIQKG